MFYNKIFQNLPLSGSICPYFLGFLKIFQLFHDTFARLESLNHSECKNSWITVKSRSCQWIQLQILNGSKPKVVAIGPYVYQAQAKKNMLGFGNGTVRYQEVHNFVFNPNISCTECSPRRKVWIPNVVYQV